MTAVEKFWQDVQDVLPPSSVSYETATKLGIAYEQAKEMEGEQREKDFVEGYKKRAKLSGLIFDESSKSSAKELFNKTLKSK
jgi:hypothetical protein